MTSVIWEVASIFGISGRRRLTASSTFRPGMPWRRATLSHRQTSAPSTKAAATAMDRSMPTSCLPKAPPDRKSTRLNSSHVAISYAVFCLKKKNNKTGKIAKLTKYTKVKEHDFQQTSHNNNND